MRRKTIRNNKIDLIVLFSWQVEVPDDWLRHPMPWEVRRIFHRIDQKILQSKFQVQRIKNEIPIHFYGRVHFDESTKTFRWTDFETVIAQGTMTSNVFFTVFSSSLKFVFSLRLSGSGLQKQCETKEKKRNEIEAFLSDCQYDAFVFC